MKKSFSLVFALATTGLVTFVAWADVRLAAPFADGMVLQRDREVAVWGTAKAGEKIKVTFAGHTCHATADEKGNWKTKLPKMSASAEGRVLTASSETTKNEQKISDVLVGEVWYVSGQSNAQLPLVSNGPHYKDRQGWLVAQMTREPLIRFVQAVPGVWPHGSYAALKKPNYPIVWKKFLPENLRKDFCFSAIGAYFALEIHNALDIPVGIVGSYRPGSNIDAWIPPEGYEGIPELKDFVNWKYRNDWTPATAKGAVTEAVHQPTVLWNEMVEAWAPMTMRGLLWYQGCHNSSNKDEALYAAKLHALYRGWSKRFENPNFKLYVVQLAPWRESWRGIQLAQAKFVAEEKNAGLVTTVDIGNTDDLHPAEKASIGKRLAALALKHDYGFDLVADPPTLQAIRAENEKLILSFKHADGWFVYDPASKLNEGFEIAGADGVWKRARIQNAKGDGAVKGREIILVADGIREPKKVRYLFQKPWIGTLYALSGLPLGPFDAEVK